MIKKLDLYIVQHIFENYPEHVEVFTNRNRAISHFKKLIKDSYPQLTKLNLDIIVSSETYEAYNGETFHLITKKPS